MADPTAEHIAEARALFGGVAFVDPLGRTIPLTVGDTEIDHVARVFARRDAAAEARGRDHFALSVQVGNVVRAENAAKYGAAADAPWEAIVEAAEARGFERGHSFPQRAGSPHGAFMRQVSHLALTPTDQAITITCDDRDPQAGNMSHDYVIRFAGVEDGPPAPNDVAIHFQHGPIKEHGVNGITNEVLLALVIDRLEGAQLGPFASTDNADAIVACRAASEALAKRTRDRIVRGVEGQSKA